MLKYNVRSVSCLLRCFILISGHGQTVGDEAVSKNIAVFLDTQLRVKFCHLISVHGFTTSPDQT